MKQEYNNFKLEIENGIAVFMVNRPEVRNAMNDECWKELGQFMDSVEYNDGVKVVIITGAGEKAFVAGADISVLRDRTGVDALNMSANNSLKKIENSSKPIIAAINGYAFGGGCELSLACDIRIVSDNARMGLPEANLGILPGLGGTQRLTRIVGVGIAKEMIMAGRVIRGPEAVDIGLAYKCVELQDLRKEAFKVAEAMMTKAPLSMGIAKKLIQSALSVDLDSGILMERYASGILMSSEDKLEGTSAFLEKRTAEFKGK